MDVSIVVHAIAVAALLGVSPPPGSSGLPVGSRAAVELPSRNWPADVAGFAREPFAVEPAGVSGDSVTFWILDGKARAILHRGAESPGIPSEIHLRLLKPRGVAYDGKNLWVSDSDTRRLYLIDAATGGERYSIPAMTPLDKGKGQVTDVSWDGRYLWTAAAAGFASSFNQIDPYTGRVLRSIYANCDPRGLAVHDGRLWSLCYNGPKLPYTLNTMRLSDKESDVHKSLVTMGAVASEEAAGLFFDGRLLWLLERTRLRSFPAEPVEIPK
jgi:hypothetical protein